MSDLWAKTCTEWETLVFGLSMAPSTLPIFVACLKVKHSIIIIQMTKVKKRNKNYNVTLLGSWEEGSQSISLRLEVSPSDGTTVTLPSSSDSTLGSAARNVIQ